MLLRRLNGVVWLAVTPLVLVFLASVNFMILNGTPPTRTLIFMPIVVGLVLGGMIQVLMRQRGLLTSLNDELARAHRDLSMQAKDLQTTNDQLRATQGAATLAVGAVHDIRNLLSPITMGASMMSVDDPEDLAMLNDIHHAATQGAALCNTILRTIQPVAQMQAYSAEVLIPEVWRRVQAMLPGFVAHEVQVQAGQVTLNKDDFVQIVHNLCLNAYQACDGKVHIVLQGLNVGDSYEISVQDNGPGLPDEVAESYGEIEMRVKHGEAHGLGTAIVKTLSTRNQLGLRVETSKAGTTITLVCSLP